MRKIRITIEHPWQDDGGPKGTEELKEELESWSGCEWAGYIDHAKIEVIEEE